MIPAVLFAPVVKLVYHASLSRRRSPVRIRSGAPVLLVETAQSEPFLLVSSFTANYIIRNRNIFLNFTLLTQLGKIVI